MEIFQIVVLSLSALLLIYGGLSRLFTPLKSFCLNAYRENSENKLANTTDMFNEMRGAGSSLALSGIAIGLGALMPEIRLTSFVVAVATFIGFTIGRLISISQDGKPNKDLMTGLFSEILLGGLNAACLVLLFL